MDLAAIFNAIPFCQHLGIEVTEVGEGWATGTLPHDEALLSNPTGEVFHGGAPYALVDTLGGAAVMSVTQEVAPTVDMRMDYLKPATTDLQSEATVVRDGSNLATVRADVLDAADELVATATGVYKVGGQGERTPWGEDPRD